MCVPTPHAPTVRVCAHTQSIVASSERPAHVWRTKLNCCQLFVHRCCYSALLNTWRSKNQIKLVTYKMMLNITTRDQWHGRVCRHRSHPRPHPNRRHVAMGHSSERPTQTKINSCHLSVHTWMERPAATLRWWTHEETKITLWPLCLGTTDMDVCAHTHPTHRPCPCPHPTILGDQWYQCDFLRVLYVLPLITIVY